MDTNVFEILGHLRKENRTNIGIVVKQSVPFYDYTNIRLAFSCADSTIKE